jgi:hypothetical protein
LFLQQRKNNGKSQKRAFGRPCGWKECLAFSQSQLHYRLRRIIHLDVWDGVRQTAILGTRGSTNGWFAGSF